MFNRYLETKVTETEVTEPIILEQAKAYATVSSSDQDDLITDLITIARKKVEAFAHISLVPKSIVLIVEAFKQHIVLPYPKINAITKVEISEGQNPDGTINWRELLLTESQYAIIGDEEKGIYVGDCGLYRIAYTTTAFTEKGLILDVKRIVNWLFRNRGDETVTMPMDLFSNAANYKLYY